ncbi:DUF6335 family protein [Alkalinema sp. FACHB-956]|uniref:DUF6335 family protein n=1 Tax=Alkalinema sp. FACHB-956 TaxID=2692768 RepID=UPI001686C2EE|nr:DUF6335 family protein [Alkalinema sp. FACHB-956]MBD2329520.1 hypothetical protein [Alkalinema sp. FACHB-956]
MAYESMPHKLSTVTGGDLDADADRAEVSGEEAVGGSAAVPGQNDTEPLAEAVGIQLADQAPLHLKAIMEQRDRDRWELQPDSAVAEQDDDFENAGDTLKVIDLESI